MEILNNQSTTVLKCIKVQIPINTKLGVNGLTTINGTDIYLPAGTLLESGNVRIPIETDDDNNITLTKIDTTVPIDCNNQNMVLYTDIENNNYSNVPANLPHLVPGSEQVCYCKIPENTNLKLNCESNSVKMKLNENTWTSLTKNTTIKMNKDSKIEFRVNGSWHKIKLIKDEHFKI